MLAGSWARAIAFMGKEGIPQMVPRDIVLTILKNVGNPAFELIELDSPQCRTARDVQNDRNYMAALNWGNVEILAKSTRRSARVRVI